MTDYDSAMPSSRSSCRTGAIRRRQAAHPRASTIEIGVAERRLPVAPLPPELAARAAADRAEILARREAILRIRRDIQQRKRAAEDARNDGLLEQLDAFARRFEDALRRPGSLDRFSS